MVDKMYIIETTHEFDIDLRNILNKHYWTSTQKKILNEVNDKFVFLSNNAHSIKIENRHDFFQKNEIRWVKLDNYNFLMFYVIRNNTVYILALIYGGMKYEDILNKRNI